MLEKILLPTDLSNESNSIFPLAVTLAQAFGSRLYLMHVMHPDSLKQPERLVDFPRLSQFFESERDAPDLPPLKSKVPVAKVYRYSSSPAEEVLEFARHKDVELLCFATTPGTRSLKRWLRGATAEKFLRHAPCSILCMRGQPIKQKDWRRPRLKHILLLTELGAHGAAPLLRALPFAHAFNSMLHIFPMLLADSNPSPEANPLREIAKINPQQTNVLLFADPTRQRRNLMQFLGRNQVDLIIMPPRARRELSVPFFSDIVERLLEEIDSPILLLH